MEGAPAGTASGGPQGAGKEQDSLGVPLYLATSWLGDRGPVIYFFEPQFPCLRKWTVSGTHCVAAREDENVDGENSR